MSVWLIVLIRLLLIAGALFLAGWLLLDLTH